ncbi:MAG: beta-lactamase family protein [Synergistaceae bacterium]|jgi:CubicO group peptidase (beta-lactamase class C family)|nr:beta-lactamase family protein [Synergistaceae bacterium]
MSFSAQPREFTANPEEVGVSERNLRYIDQAMQRSIDDKTLKGIVTLVARHGKIVQLKAYGEADEGVPMQTDCIFRLASMSKTIGAVALLRLVDQGKLLLTDPVSKYIPGFANLKVVQPGPDGKPVASDLERCVTVHHLLTMTAGTARIGASGRPGAEIYSDKLKELGICDTMHPLDETIGEIVDKVATIPLASQPGTRFEYSNVAVITAGRIVELVSGMPLADYLQKYILDPLDMVDTAFFPPESKWPRIPQVFESGTMKRLDKLDIPGTDDTQVPFSKVQKFHNIAGGLNGTAYDYFRFAQMLLNGGELYGTRIISRNAVKLLSTNQVGDLRDNFRQHAWGYLAGVQVDYNTQFNYLGLGSFGWYGYWGTIYNIWPEKDALVIFLTQASPEDYPRLSSWQTQGRFFSIVSGAIMD